MSDVQKADKFWAFVSVAPDGRETLVAAKLGGYLHPLCTVFENVVPHMREVAVKHADASKRPVRLVEYQVARELEVLEPKKDPADEGIECDFGACPGCHAKPDRMTVLPGEKLQLPKPGDIALCSKCASMNVITDERALRELTTEEFVDLPIEQRSQLQKAQRIMREILAEPKA